MRKLQVAVALFVLFVSALWSGCGGGGSVGGPPPPPPVPSATFTASTATITLGQSVTLTWSSTNTTSCVASGAWSGSKATSGSEVVTPGATGNFSYTLQCDGSGGSVSKSVSVTVNAPPLPTIAVTPGAATVEIGSTQDFAAQTTNVTSPPTCASPLFGNVPVSGSAPSFTASYAVPASSTPPTAFTDTMTCTATNGAGQNQASASITLEYPTPAITSVNPQTSGTIYVRSGRIVGNFAVNGSGFVGGGSGTIVPDERNLVSLQLPSWNQFLLTLGFGVNVAPVGQTPFNPGFFGISATSPPGHGGGTSNVANFAFLGDQNTLVFNGTHAFQLDQAAGVVWKFKLSDGSADGSFNVGAKTTGIAIDEGGTGLVIVSSSIAVNGYDPTTGLAKVGAGPGGTAVSARNGFVCWVNGVDAVSCADFTQPNPSPITANVAGTPWNVAMATLGGNLMAVVWTIESNTLTKFSVPSLNATGAVGLTGLTPASQLPAALGGWQLQAFHSGPSQGMAAVLAQFDKTIVFVNLGTMAEAKRVVLSGLPFRMGKNEADGSVVVALADVAAGLTRFVRVAPDGTVTALTAAVPFLATGFQVSADGTKLYCANRGQFQIVLNQ